MPEISFVQIQLKANMFPVKVLLNCLLGFSPGKPACIFLFLYNGYFSLNEIPADRKTYKMAGSCKTVLFNFFTFAFYRKSKD